MRLTMLGVMVLAAAIGYLTYMLNRPVKFAEGTCLESQKGSYILRITSVDRADSAYGAQVVKSNHSKDGVYALDNKISASFSQIDDDNELSQVSCPLGAAGRFAASSNFRRSRMDLKDPRLRAYSILSLDLERVEY